VAVGGVTGLTRNIYWDLQNPNTDAGYLKRWNTKSATQNPAKLVSNLKPDLLQPQT